MPHAQPDTHLLIATRAALASFGITPRRITQIASRHNDVFRIDDTSRRRFVLRIQNDLLSDAHARSQLLWLDALAEQGDVTVPQPVRTVTGEPFTRVDVAGQDRRAVLLRWLPGRVTRSRRPEVYRAAARMIARMHLHAERHRPPKGFACRTLDAAWLFGPRFFVRHPHARGHVTAAQRRIAHTAERLVRDAMGSAGRNRKQFGLIHADLNPANIIFHHGEPCPIDFDEFGRGWYLYDLAELIRTSVTVQNYASQKSLVLRAYQQIRPLAEVDESRFDGFLIATYVQYLNWAFGHARDTRDLRWASFCIDVIRHVGDRLGVK